MKWYSSSMLLRGAGVGQAIDAVARAGYDGIEVWVDHAVEHGEAPAELARRIADAGIGSTVHASSYDINVTAMNPGIRHESVRQTVQSLEFAAHLGAPLVVVHPGRLSSSRDDPERYWPLLLDALERMDRQAVELGVTVGLELMEKRPKEIFMLPADARRVMAHGFRALGITVDLAHSWSHGDAVAFLKEMDRESIVHVHLSDSDPATVHLPLGEGQVELEPLFACLVEIGWSGAVNVEGYAPGRGNDLIEANLEVIRRVSASLDARARA